MRDTIPADEILSRANAIGQYYGFTPLSILTAKTRGAKKKGSGLPDTLAKESLDPVATTVTQFLKQFRQTDPVLQPRQPLFVWHTNIAPGRPAQKKVVVQFHAIGTDRALADAVVIRALIALSRDLFREEPVLHINSMGDKETRARYARELGTFFKKRGQGLPEECLLRAKDDTLDAAAFAIENACADDLPAPTDHLSDASRKRFEDLLEYLEMTATPYELARHLISRGNAWNDTCFELTAGDKHVAWGSRYNELARSFFPDTSVNATGAVLTISSGGGIVKKPSSSRIRYSFVHIGDEAKHEALRLAEELRKARVPLVQHLGVESLVEQLDIAERINSPYLLIMGRKEALEGSVILRDRTTQVETVLPLDSLVEQLRATA